MMIRSSESRGSRRSLRYGNRTGSWFCIPAEVTIVVGRARHIPQRFVYYHMCAGFAPECAMVEILFFIVVTFSSKRAGSPCNRYNGSPVCYLFREPLLVYPLFITLHYDGRQGGRKPGINASQAFFTLWSHIPIYAVQSTCYFPSLTREEHGTTCNRHSPAAL